MKPLTRKEKAIADNWLKPPAVSPQEFVRQQNEKNARLMTPEYLAFLEGLSSAALNAEADKLDAEREELVTQLRREYGVKGERLITKKHLAMAQDPRWLKFRGKELAVSDAIGAEGHMFRLPAGHVRLKDRNAAGGTERTEIAVKSKKEGQ